MLDDDETAVRVDHRGRGRVTGRRLCRRRQVVDGVVILGPFERESGGELGVGAEVPGDVALNDVLVERVARPRGDRFLRDPEPVDERLPQRPVARRGRAERLEHLQPLARHRLVVAVDRSDHVRSGRAKKNRVRAGREGAASTGRVRRRELAELLPRLGRRVLRRDREEDAAALLVVAQIDAQQPVFQQPFAVAGAVAGAAGPVARVLVEHVRHEPRCVDHRGAAGELLDPQELAVLVLPDLADRPVRDRRHLQRVPQQVVADLAVQVEELVAEAERLERVSDVPVDREAVRRARDRLAFPGLPGVPGVVDQLQVEVLEDGVDDLLRRPVRVDPPHVPADRERRAAVEAGELRVGRHALERAHARGPAQLRHVFAVDVRAAAERRGELRPRRHRVGSNDLLDNRRLRGCNGAHTSLHTPASR